MPPEAAIAFSESLWEELCGALSIRYETAGVLLAGAAEDHDTLVFTVNSVVRVPDQHYLERRHDRLSIRSPGWVPSLKRAAESRLHPIFFHTHPGGAPTASEHDDAVDRVLAPSFLTRARVPRYISFILGGDQDAPSLTGRVLNGGGESMAITKARIVGRRIRILPAFDRPEADADARLHDRQIRAFGADGQRILRSLRVGVVGAGGTGSSVLEQLIRLGVRDIISVDDDHITTTNVSRVYGSSVSHDGHPKVDVAHENAERIGLDTRLRAHQGRTNTRASLELLRTRDVIFGCTDDHVGRFNLSLLAFHYLVPLIDLGVVIDAPKGDIRSITGRITYVAPGQPCLICHGVVDRDLVRDEAYADQERDSLAAEGYARGLGEPDPAVVTYTTMVGAWGISDLLERLFSFGRPDVANETLLRIADRKMVSRQREPAQDHICGTPGVWARGDQPNFLGMRVWP